MFYCYQSFFSRFIFFYIYIYALLLFVQKRGVEVEKINKESRRGQPRVRGLEKYFSHGGDEILTRRASTILHRSVSLHCASTLSSYLTFPASTYFFLKKRERKKYCMRIPRCFNVISVLHTTALDKQTNKQTQA